LSRATPAFFIKDGAGEDAIQRQRQEIYREAEAGVEPPAPQPAPPPPLKAKDAVVNVNGDGIWISKKDVRIKGRESQSVPVVPEGVDPKRGNTVVATSTMSRVGDDGAIEQIVYAGQMCSRDHPLALLNPYNLRYPDPA
jgi:hypothetical protein